MRTKSAVKPPIKRIRTIWHIVVRIRTKFPPPIPIRIVRRKDAWHGIVYRLSKSHCKALERVLLPPLTESQIIERKGRQKLIPDMSHMTPWDPSRRK